MLRQADASDVPKGQLSGVGQHSFFREVISRRDGPGMPIRELGGRTLGNDRRERLRFRIVSVDAGREFAVVTLESPRSYLWQPGMVKARFLPAADGQILRRDQPESGLHKFARDGFWLHAVLITVVTIGPVTPPLILGA
jgi:hypothetical protein